MYGAKYKLEKWKEKIHDLNHDLTFSAHTINCVCHRIRSMFRVLGIYSFGGKVEACNKGNSDLSSYHSSQVRKCLTIKSLRPAKGGKFTFYVQINRSL